MENKLTYEEQEKQLEELKKENEILKIISNKETKDYHLLLFENSLDGFTYCQMIYGNEQAVDFMYLNASPSFENLTGLKGVKGRKISEFFDKDNPLLLELVNQYGEVATTGIASRFEFNFTPLKKWFAISAICPKKGFFIAIFDDITEKKIIEHALIESEEKFREIFEILPVGVSITDKDFNVIEKNQRLREILSLNDTEIDNKLYKKRKYINSAGEELNNKDFPSYRAFHENKRILNFEIGVVINEDEITWTKVSATPIPSEKYGVAIVTTDITERKKLELAIKESEEKYHTIATNTLDIINRFDKNYRHIYVSPSAERITGIKAKEFIGKTHRELGFPAIECDSWEKMIADVFNKRVSIKNIIEYDGVEGKVYLDWLLNPEFDNSNNIISVLGHVRDITDLMQIENSLKDNEIKLNELNATKDKFFSIIAHDLRSPFNAILGFSRLLVESVDLNEYDELKKFANIILDSSKKTVNLIDNLLEWSYTQTDKIRFEPEYINLNNNIKDVVGIAKDSAIQKSIRINNFIPEDINIYADSAMLNSILRNLISNAIKFTNIGGHIDLSCQQLNNELNIIVSDNGVGIHQDSIGKLFRIDETVSTYGTAKEKGSGLGLILCKEFVEKHGGRIWVESIENEGSKFCFTVPESSL